MATARGVATGKPVVRIGTGQLGIQLDVDRPTTPGAEAVATGVDHDSPEPRLELRGIAQLPEVAPRGQRRVVRGVLRVRAVAEDQRRVAIGAVEHAPIHQLGEGLRSRVVRAPDVGVLRLHHRESLQSGHVHQTTGAGETFNRGTA